MRDATGKGRVDVTYATRNVFAYTAKRMRVVVSTENGERRTEEDTRRRTLGQDAGERGVDEVVRERDRLMGGLE